MTCSRGLEPTYVSAITTFPGSERPQTRRRCPNRTPRRPHRKPMATTPTSTHDLNGYLQQPSLRTDKSRPHASRPTAVMCRFTLETDGVRLARQQSIGGVHAPEPGEAPMRVGHGPRRREKPREPATVPSRSTRRTRPAVGYRPAKWTAGSSRGTPRPIGPTASYRPE